MTAIAPTSAPLRLDAGIRAVKGHGTENDFIIVIDPDDRFAWLGSEFAERVCDRRSGLGADGVIRAARAPVGSGAGADGSAEPAWLMDYRNSDGSVGLMCGNGIRVMAEALRRDGLAGADTLDVLTAAGPRRLHRRFPGVWAVEMGLVSVGVPDGSALDAAPGDTEVDTLVAVPGLGEAPRSGMSVDVGNPHVVVALTGLDELAGLDLRHAPHLLPHPAEGANVEFVAVLGYDGDAGTGRLAMRVHERGSGETRSCGTGAVAAATAAAVWAGEGAPHRWSVDVAGGALEVELEGGRAVLVGPAVIVADIVLDAGWLGG